MEARHYQSEIAKLLDRQKFIISRELSRITGSRGYRPKQTCEMSTHRSQNSRNAGTVAPRVKQQANALLRVQSSPEQIASKLPISYETVYPHLYSDKTQGGALCQNLCCQKQKRKCYAVGRDRLGQIPNRRPLNERPLQIEARRQVGHWECDTVIGTNHKGAVVTMVQRKNGYGVHSQGNRQNIRVGLLSHCGQAQTYGGQGQDAYLRQRQ